MRRAHSFSASSARSIATTTTLAAIAAVSLAACGPDSPDEMPSTEPSVAIASEPTPPVTTASAEGTVSPATFVVPENVSYEMAESAFIDRRYDEAKAMFEVYSNNKPENPWGHYMLGLSAWKSGDASRAVEAFEEALSLDPKHVKSLLNLSRVLLDLGRADEALARIDSARAIDSTSADVHRLLGRAYGELGRTDESIESYRRAIVLDEKDVWAMNNLGLVLIREGRYEDALRPLARAVELRGDVATFRNNLGVALERTGHFTLAAESFRKAVELDSTYTKASISLKRVEGRVEKPETVPVDLGLLAKQFVEEMEGWTGTESVPPVESIEPVVVVPPGC